MKRISVLAIVLLASLCWGQSDIVIAGTGPNWEIKGRTWGAQLNNGYFMTSRPEVNGICVVVRNNNPTNAHVIDLALTTTPDPNSNGGFFSTFSAWTTDYSTISQGIISIAASQSYTTFVPIAGAAKFELLVFSTVTQAGNPDTADIFISPTQGYTSCSTTGGTVFPSMQGSPNLTGDGNGYVGMRRPIACEMSKAIVVATATTVTVQTNNGGATAFQKIHVCGFQITGAPSTAAALQFFDGTAGTCATPGAILWQTNSGVSASLDQVAMAAGGTELFESLVKSQPLCFRDNGTTSGVTLSVSYTVFQ